MKSVCFLNAFNFNFNFNFVKTSYVTIVLFIQIEEGAVEMFDSITRSDNVRIDMSIPTDLQSLPEYLEGWRMKLWEHAYTGVFKGSDAFKKSDSFKDYKGSGLAVKRVIYRYKFTHIPFLNMRS